VRDTKKWFVNIKMSRLIHKEETRKMRERESKQEERLKLKFDR